MGEFKHQNWNTRISHCRGSHLSFFLMVPKRPEMDFILLQLCQMWGTGSVLSLAWDSCQDLSLQEGKQKWERSGISCSSGQSHVIWKSWLSEVWPNHSTQHETTAVGINNKTRAVCEGTGSWSSGPNSALYEQYIRRCQSDLTSAELQNTQPGTQWDLSLSFCDSHLRSVEGNKSSI